MNEKELIRRALMGDKQAQDECTERGIVLPCPCCRGNAKLEDMGHPHHVYCVECGLKSTSTKYGEDGDRDAIHKWNTRPAPPIGRCGECKYFRWLIGNSGFCEIESPERISVSENDFCSSFEPREEE